MTPASTSIRQSSGSIERTRPQPLEPEHDAAERDGAAREAGAAAARRDRDVVLVAPGDDLGDLVGGPRQHDRVRVPAQAARLGRVREVGRGHAVEHEGVAEAGAQLLRRRRGRHAHARRTGFVSEPIPSISTVTSSPSAR